MFTLATENTRKYYQAPILIFRTGPGNEASSGLQTLLVLHLATECISSTFEKYLNELISKWRYMAASKQTSIPYSGKFLQGPNFHDFRDPRPKRENKNREIRTAKIWTQTFVWTFELVEIFTCAFCVLVSLDLTTVLYRYFKPADDVLSSPTGHLSSSVSPATIKGRGQ